MFNHARSGVPRPSAAMLVAMAALVLSVTASAGPWA